ncbi:TetR/AcrR family transcriptional regulator [Mycolicibacterium sp. S2-37]|uniref:TetR/AcrR family transcriptional regulator n=1 Tax=Mycolicibacterium sp. S2-37 TaxID=2810297 RepID=UPI001A940C7C|nr:TetR/AcrR family transcriptional regulator [Mycolicibacterium sp. S2-37]MBO0681301.1 TetR/AcrR family transcriptional regulator [Mycolicibacterium sp. S2-37]
MLDAAESLVVRSGLDGFTVDDVTTGAGVAKGTFYLHFSNKAGLIDALRERYLHRFVEAQMTAAAHASGVAQIEQWLRVGVTEYLREIRLHDVLFHSGSVERDAPNQAVDALAGLLADSELPVEDPFATAVILYSAMHGATDHIAHAPEDQQRMLAVLVKTCRALLG